MINVNTNKLHCSHIYRIPPEGPPETVAQVGGEKDTLAYETVVRDIISNDRPLSCTVSSSLGGFKVVQQDHFRVVYGSDGDGICLAVVTNMTYPSRIAIEMLQELYTKVPADVLTGKTRAIGKKDVKALKVVHTKYSDFLSVDKVACLQGKVDVVKDRMEHNITQALENMESAESLAETAQQVTAEAAVFHKNAEKLRKHMAWKNLQMTLLVGAIVAIICVILLGPLLR